MGQTQAGLISPVGFFTEKGEKKHNNEEQFAVKEHTASKLRARLTSVHGTDGSLCLVTALPTLTIITGRVVRSHSFCVLCVVMCQYRCTQATGMWGSEDDGLRCGSSLPLFAQGPPRLLIKTNWLKLLGFLLSLPPVLL